MNDGEFSLPIGYRDAFSVRCSFNKRDGVLPLHSVWL